MSRKPDEVDCGTVQRYRQGCRCQPCKDANAVAKRESKHRQRALHGRPPGTVTHGTTYAYDVFRCRCEDCIIGHNRRRGEASRGKSQPAVLPGESYRERARRAREDAS